MSKEILMIQQDCCLPRALLPADYSQIEGAALVFAALADPTRLAILKLLLDGQEEVCVCDITENFHLSQSTISHHLKLLRDAQLVSTSKRGKWVYYSLQKENVKKVYQLLKTMQVVSDTFQVPSSETDILQCS